MRHAFISHYPISEAFKKKRNLTEHHAISGGRCSGVCRTSLPTLYRLKTLLGDIGDIMN